VLSVKASTVFLLGFGLSLGLLRGLSCLWVVHCVLSHYNEQCRNRNRSKVKSKCFRIIATGSVPGCVWESHVARWGKVKVSVTLYHRTRVRHPRSTTCSCALVLSRTRSFVVITFICSHGTTGEMDRQVLPFGFVGLGPYILGDYRLFAQTSCWATDRFLTRSL
jgi:hypothetical protein